MRTYATSKTVLSARSLLVLEHSHKASERADDAHENACEGENDFCYPKGLDLEPACLLLIDESAKIEATLRSEIEALVLVSLPHFSFRDEWHRDVELLRFLAYCLVKDPIHALVDAFASAVTVRVDLKGQHMVS